MKCRIKGVPSAMNGLSVEDNQVKHLSPDTMMFTGKSHAQGGVDINYNGKQVEVESGEPAFLNDEGTLNIMGNLQIPGTNTKFKSAFKKIAKEENKVNNIKDKAAILLNDNDPMNRYQSLSFGSGKVLADAYSQKDRAISSLKDNLSSIQDMMLQSGASSMRNGGSIAKDGKSIGVLPDALQNIKNSLGAAESSNNYFAGNGSSSAFGKYQFIKGTRKQYYNKYYKDQYPTFDSFESAYRRNPQVQEDLMNHHLEDLASKFKGNTAYIMLAHRLGEGAAMSLKNKGYYMDGNGRKITMDTPIGSSQKPTDKETPNQYLEKNNIPDLQESTPLAYGNNNLKLIPSADPLADGLDMTNRQPIAQPDGMIEGMRPIPQEMAVNKYQQPYTPHKMTSLADNNKLGIGEILPELLTTLDTPDYVQGQYYDPQLLNPYQVSFQDKLNQNNSTFKAIARNLVNNPEALATLAAQKYESDNGVLSDQFRTNQGISSDITNKNNEILNNAALTNINLADTQYSRQAAAIANTRNRKYEAAASISNKIGARNDANKQIQLYESMSGYRYNPLTGQQEYQGGPTDFSSYNNSSSTPTRKVIKTNKDGTTEETQYYDALDTQKLEDQKRNASYFMKKGR